MSDLDETIVVEDAEVVAEAEPKAPKQKTYSAKDDPRAMAAIRRAKGAGGLGGFALTGLAAHLHGELMTSVLLRALGGGLAGYMIAWLAAVTIWRRIIRAEIHHTIETMAQRIRSQTDGSAVQGQ